MMLMKEVVEILNKAVVLYEELAELNGQGGDIHSYEEMMNECKKIMEVCETIEKTYQQHQTINRIQLYTLLKDEMGEIYPIVDVVLEIYKNELEGKREKIRGEQEKIEAMTSILKEF